MENFRRLRNSVVGNFSFAWKYEECEILCKMLASNNPFPRAECDDDFPNIARHFFGALFIRIFHPMCSNNTEAMGIEVLETFFIKHIFFFLNYETEETSSWNLQLRRIPVFKIHLWKL